jgi:tRNA(Ile)-lysidine synthase
VLVEQVRARVRASGLTAGDRPLLAMISAGRDSTCLLDVLVALHGAAAVSAVHVNYGLRDAAAGDELRCAALCEQLGVGLEVVRAGPGAPAAPGAPRAAGGAPAAEHALGGEGAPGGTGAAGAEEAASEAAGNLQAWARELRYEAARRIAADRGGLIATGHTASDQVETILYRLAASPGRRALLGMGAREGALVRPLLGVSREQTAGYCSERGLEWREDASNEDERFARTRVRRGLLPALCAVHPAAESNVLRTAALLREETELLDALVEQELAGADSIALARLEELPAALARLLVVRLAERAAGTYVPQAGARVAEIIALGRRGGRAELHVGGRAGAVIAGGLLTMVRLPPRARSVPPGED